MFAIGSVLAVLGVLVFYPVALLTNSLVAGVGVSAVVFYLAAAMMWNGRVTRITAYLAAIPAAVLLGLGLFTLRKVAGNWATCIAHGDLCVFATIGLVYLAVYVGLLTLMFVKVRRYLRGPHA